MPHATRIFLCSCWIAGLLAATSHAAAPADPQAPPPRSRAEIEAVLKKAPRSEAKLRPLRILLVAGPKDHGPGEHDYPLWQKTWAPLLAKAPSVQITTAFPWPTPEQWKEADLAVCYFHTAWTADQIAAVEALQNRGGGVVLIHWAVGVDKEFDKFAARFGLAYKAAGFRHGVTDLKFAPDQRITLGFPRELRFTDEPYWPFLGDAKGINVLATSNEKVKADVDPQPVPVFWTFEPAKGRAFVSVFGHYTWTFDDPYFRLLLLRGMAWAAGESPYRFDALAVDGVKLAD